MATTLEQPTKAVAMLWWSRANGPGPLILADSKFRSPQSVRRIAVDSFANFSKFASNFDDFLEDTAEDRDWNQAPS